MEEKPEKIITEEQKKPDSSDNLLESIHEDISPKFVSKYNEKSNTEVAIDS